MATKYTLISLPTGDAVSTYARKDGAIKAAERDGLVAYEVQTDSGKVVHAVDNRPADNHEETPMPEPTALKAVPDPAPKPAKKAAAKKATAPKKAAAPKPEKVQHTGQPIAYTKEDGAALFFPVMGAAAETLAKALGHETVTVDKATRTLYVDGNKTTAKATAKAVHAMWASVYSEFKEWKKTTKDARREWYKSNDGKREMLSAELSFLETATAKYIAASDVL
jgi:hypothetical protein